MNADPYEPLVPFYDAWTQGPRASQPPGDVEFYVRRALEVPGPMIELGIGTGRIAIPIATAGRRVIGVDASPAMLAEARRRAADAGVADLIAFAEADMRAFVAEAPVHLVAIPYRTFLHLLTTGDQLACLASVRRSLVPGGRVALNMFVPDPDFIAGQDRRRNLHAEFTDTHGRRCELWVTPEYEATTQRITLRAVVDSYEGERHAGSTEAALELRMVYRYEMEHLLARAGFEVEAVYGDFDERPLAEGCREMIWVARRPG